MIILTLVLGHSRLDYVKVICSGKWFVILAFSEFLIPVWASLRVPTLGKVIKCLLKAGLS